VKKLYIIIPKFNGEKEIKDCLASLQLIKVPKGWEIGIVVVDNIEMQNAKFKMQNENLKLKIIKNKKNLGFAGGVNVGIREALKNGAEAVLLLNQDTKVEKDFLPPLLENPADIVGPVIKFKRGERWVYDYGGRINWWGNKHFENYELRINELTNYELDYVSGCAMMIKRRVFEKIGLFDERYFLYFEDADFCLRAKRAGFKIAVEPKSLIIHCLKEGRKKPLWQRWQLAKSNFIFINRWIEWWKRPFAWGFWAVRGIKILIG
jgi:GT2 family glycosyltransferase